MSSTVYRDKAGDKAAGKADGVLHALRRRIVRGEYAPGDRLPNRLELCRRFDVSNATVQCAVDVLQRDGFAKSRGRLGTYVTDNPPHLTRYGLVLPLPSDRPEQYPRSYTELMAYADQLTRDGVADVASFFGVDGVSDRQADRQLRSDLANHRLAGLFIHHAPDRLIDTPILADPDLPRVVQWYEPFGRGCHTLVEGNTTWLRTALADVAANGCRSVAIATSGYTGLSVHRLMDTVREASLTTRPGFVQFLYPHFQFEHRGTRHILYAMLDRPAEDRPDALLVQDQSQVAVTLSTLSELGIEPGRDMHLVMQCDPITAPPRDDATARWLGFDYRRSIDLAIDIIGRRRRGEPAPETIKLEPEFFHPTARGRASLTDVAVGAIRSN